MGVVQTHAGRGGGGGPAPPAVRVSEMYQVICIGCTVAGGFHYAGQQGWLQNWAGAE